jgi:hypothetical protein
MLKHNTTASFAIVCQLNNVYLIVVVSLTWAQGTAVIRAVNWFIAAQFLACLYIAQHKSFLSIKREMLQRFTWSSILCLL